MSTAGRVWIITGAGSGFGKAMTELVLSKGEIAVATDINITGLDDLRKQHGEDKLLVRVMDVRNAEQVASVFNETFKKFGKIDVVHNNAGLVVAGELEVIPLDAGRNQVETNFWGTLNVTLESIRTFRERNPQGVNGKPGGFLLITSSLCGVSVSPALAYYVAAKHATEGVTESLIAELDPEWNIKVAMVEPGMFRTSFNSIQPYPPHPAYKKKSLGANIVRKLLTDMTLNVMPGDPVKAVQQMYKLTVMPDPPLRLALGKDCVNAIREQLTKMLDDVDKYEDWSDDLLVDN
ncbi:NAD(P)-binding protein [Abortiporus biennis]|nr:NAD(P)-binding protein [Abortiporus biennis]